MHRFVALGFLLLTISLTATAFVAIRLSVSVMLQVFLDRGWMSEEKCDRQSKSGLLKVLEFVMAALIALLLVSALL